MSEYRELLLGCGHRREKMIKIPGHEQWANLTTLDMNPDCKPDILIILNAYPRWGSVPWMEEELLPDNSYNEIHAYEILEHLGRQGNVESFFHDFGEIWRILKPNGYLCATTPAGPTWTWGDPGHRRVINEGSLVFLSHAEYEKQLGQTPMSDYRSLLGKTNFEIIEARKNENCFWFVLKALK